MKSGCSTSIAALQAGFAQLALGYDSVMVACAETLSKVVNPSIKETWFGFGDGAAALHFSRSGTPRFEIEAVLSSSEGEYVDLYTVPGQLPPNRRDFNEGRYFMSGDAQEMKVLALKRYTDMIQAIVPPEERSSITHFIPHQVNLGLIHEVLQASQLSPKNLIWDAREVGNLGGASIVYSIARSLQEERFKAGDRILLASVGGGLSYGAQLWRVLG